MIKDRVKAKPGGLIRKLLDQELCSAMNSPWRICFSRCSPYPPRRRKRSLALSQVQEYRAQGVEDLMWGLLNKLDFIFEY